jgi:predicted transposase YdaD
MPYITSVERQGIEQGKKEGRQEGEATLVLRLLNRRLGQVSTTVEEQVRQLPVEQLENLGEALLDFESEADLLHWLGNVRL